MNLSLSGFQDAFVSALYGTDPSALPSLAQQAGFMVYRNTVMKGASDALLANFPTVERIVGTEWLRAAASVYLHDHPPSDARLLFYGTDFAHFLDNFEHAREMPYLGNIARLDRFWIEAHSAAEQAGTGLAELTRIEPLALLGLYLEPHVAARWAWFSDQPAYSLWRLNREKLDIPEDLQWSAEGALLTRKDGLVQWQELSRGGCIFLDACAASLSLGEAAQRALDAQPELDLNELLICLVSANAFAANQAAGQQ
ncbi:DNA-binding domain-containing protein [Pseudomonas syringae]|uniref:Putative DNA-binding domain-containing protein n=1 Tax=Pseudomonas syringae TaxID=317 RepID=A0A085V586_PSESX|nr:DNA-binding domain-containing protein [Pseudomonas syringae]KFE50599.1 hypothetical protein IV01_25095 [Pseudomonas syringae]